MKKKNNIRIAGALRISSPCGVVIVVVVVNLHRHRPPRSSFGRFRPSSRRLTNTWGSTRLEPLCITVVFVVVLIRLFSVVVA